MNIVTKKITDRVNTHEAFDEEERDIIEAIERDELVSVPVTQDEEEKIRQIAQNTLNIRKNKAISIRISEHDLEALRTKAAEQGMPYQTLITSVLHRYIHGTL
jgi:predicted DNA binding CopG/RHH family protein